MNKINLNTKQYNQPIIFLLYLKFQNYLFSFIFSRCYSHK